MNEMQEDALWFACATGNTLTALALIPIIDSDRVFNRAMFLAANNKHDEIVKTLEDYKK